MKTTFRLIKSRFYQDFFLTFREILVRLFVLVVMVYVKLAAGFPPPSSSSPAN
ncbi:MAG: hypothetical protein GX050_08390 [Firmicutes bacterium]|nr:hypothetical protein [Bacillota bacterium]